MNFRRLILCVFAWVLGGCGGGSGGGSDPAGAVAAATTGELTIGIRDASGDFLTYDVDVTSLRLLRENGDVVETVPLSTRIDFSELTELTEFFTVATVPSGTYTRVSLGLDFSNAEIVVQDDAGNAVPVIAVDDAGAPLTHLTVSIRLPGADVVRIASGIPAAVTLDFDLAASNEIDLISVPASVVVQPFLSVIPEFERDRSHRVRGLLGAVNTTAGTVTLKVRPFHVRAGEFGRATFATNDATQWEIDGVAYLGDEGLTQLASAALDTPVVAQGPVVGRRLTAAHVLAGSSVPWAGANVLTGVVTARAADSLTVRGAHLDLANDTHAFAREFTLLVGPDTHVTALAINPGVLDEDSISIGQRVVAFGELTDDHTLDATRGRVRMELTHLGGVVVQADPLVVDLIALAGVRPAVFDFSGTGAATATDANAERYEIDTALLGLRSLEADDIVRVRGLVNAFGAAPPDFLARTVIDVDSEPAGALLLVSWLAHGGTTEPFLGVSADRIDVDLSAARHVLKQFDMTDAAFDHAPRIALLAPADARGIYLVAVRGAREVHVLRDFASLTSELLRQLSAGNRLTRIGAHGRYNAADEALTTPRASFEFTQP